MKKVMAFIIIAVCSMVIPQTAEAKQLTEDEVYQIALEVTEHYNICPEFLQAMAFRESSYRTDVENGSCIGLMQVSEKWHKDRMERLGVESLYDPYGNMLVAADYLTELFGEGDELYGERRNFPIQPCRIQSLDGERLQLLQK